MKRLLYLIPILLLLFFVGCDSGTGSVTVNLTDAPVDDSSVEGVYITVTGIGYNTDSSEDWVDVADFEGPQTYNLLDLTGGITEMLGEFVLPAGKITQMRFYLDAPVTGGGTPTSPGCYILLVDDETEYPLYVPSGGNSGFKAVGEFDVPLNGSVSITADFDVRKSVRDTNNGYKLQPTIKISVDDEAGRISGEVTYSGSNDVIIFAYEDGEYASSEAEAPVSENDDPAFFNAVTSGTVADNDGTLEYVLPFLAAGTYDLVAVEIDSEGNYLTDSILQVADVAVTSGDNTTQAIIFE